MPKERRALLLPPSAAHLPPPSSPAAAAAAKNAAADDGHFTHLPAEKGLDERSGVFLFTLCVCVVQSFQFSSFFFLSPVQCWPFRGKRMQICGHFGAAPPVSLLELLLRVSCIEKCYFTLCTFHRRLHQRTHYSNVIHYSALAIVLSRLNVLMLSDAALDLVVAGCCCILIFSRK